MPKKKKLRGAKPANKAAVTAPKMAKIPGGDEITQSTAFRRAAIDAEAYARDPKRLRQLLEDAVGKIGVIPRGPFAETWPYLMAMIRLIRDYHRAEYRDISETNLLTIIAGYDLDEDCDVDPETLSTTELIELIVGAVRGRRAA